MSDTTPLLRFRWWYKGKTPQGNTMSLTGHVKAANTEEAQKTVEANMRKKFPDVKWMHGKEVEDNFQKFGPTTQQLKTLGKANKPKGNPAKKEETT